MPVGREQQGRGELVRGAERDERGARGDRRGEQRHGDAQAGARSGDEPSDRAASSSDSGTCAMPARNDTRARGRKIIT